MGCHERWRSNLEQEFGNKRTKKQGVVSSPIRHLCSVRSAHEWSAANLTRRCILITARDKLILVIGATGQQGGAVVKALQKTNCAIRALVRAHGPTDPKTEKVRQLEQEGVQIAQGDLDDFNSLVQAMKGCYGVFSVATFWQKGGVQKETQQGNRAADAAKAAGVQHFVYSSVGGAER